MLALRDRPNPSPPPAPDATDSTVASASRERVIVCAACAAVITHARQRIAMLGAHEHRFMNPAGYLFHIGCFALAIGCVVVGPASLEYPWFAGTAWRFALCGQCGQHLGWHFRAHGGDGFFGLVLDRLREGMGTLDA